MSEKKRKVHPSWVEDDTLLAFVIKTNQNTNKSGWLNIRISPTSNTVSFHTIQKHSYAYSMYDEHGNIPAKNHLKFFSYSSQNATF